MSAAGEAPTTFDPAAFVADLRAAGCGVVLSLPGTWFKPGDEVPTYFIRPGPGHCSVMAKWSDAIQACPGHVEQVAALLAERWEAGA